MFCKQKTIICFIYIYIRVFSQYLKPFIFHVICVASNNGYSARTYIKKTMTCNTTSQALNLPTVNTMKIQINLNESPYLYIHGHWCIIWKRHGNTFRIIGPSYGESIDYRWVFMLDRCFCDITFIYLINTGCVWLCLTKFYYPTYPAFRNVFFAYMLVLLSINRNLWSMPCLGILSPITLKTCSVYLGEYPCSLLTGIWEVAFLPILMLFYGYICLSLYIYQ